MKLLIVFCAAIFLVSGAPRTQIDEDEWSFDKEGVATAADQRTDSPIFEYDYDFVLTESAGGVMMTEKPTTEEPSTTTTKKAKTTKATTTTTTTTTTTVKPIALESTGEKTKTGRKPSINRTRAPSTSSRRVASTTTIVAVEDLEEVTESAPETPKRGGQKIKSTSPSSLDTSSVAIKAPSKGFKPTAKPMSEEEPKDLMEFLKKRKEERIQATTTIDPFIAILATATPLPTAEPVTVAGGGRGSGSSSSGGSRFSGISSRRGSSGARITARPTTESAPIEVATEARRSGLPSSNRFSNSRKASTTTTTAQPTIDAPEFQVESTTKSKLTPKRPAVFRPVSNSILRKKDQTTTTTAAPTDVIAPQETEPVSDISAVEEMDLEPVVTTRRPLRRAQSKLLSSSS